MAKYASIKRRPKEEARPSPRTIAHNQRYNEIADLLSKKYRKTNYHMVKVSNATKTFDTWAKKNEDRYKEINKRKLRSDAIRLESLAIILSAEQVSQNDPYEIWIKAQEFKEWFEARYKTKVRTMDWHRDEGSFDVDGNLSINEHIHLEFDNVNEDGKMVRRLFSKGDLIAFQDKIAEIYKPLGFIRGEDTAKKHKDATPKRGAGQKAFKADKKRGALTELQTANKAMRAELQEHGVKREQYAELEALNKKLKINIGENKISAAEAITELLQTKYKTIERLKSIAYTGNTINIPKNPKPVKETYKGKAKRAEQQNQKLKDQNERYRKDRRNEYQRAIDRTKQATKHLGEPTTGDIRGATQAYKTKQTARANAQIASRFSHNFIQFHEKFKGNIQQITDNLYIKKIDRLKASKHKTTLDDVKNFNIKVANKTTTIDEFILKLKAENKELKASKRKGAEEVLDQLSKLSGINSNKLFDLVDQEIKKQNKPLDIKIESTVIDYENFDVALVSGEWLSKDELTEPTEQELKAIKDEGFSQSIDLISKKLSKVIQNLNKFISDSWQRLRIQKTSENPPIDKKTARVTSSKQKYKKSF